MKIKSLFAIACLLLGLSGCDNDRPDDDGWVTVPTVTEAVTTAPPPTVTTPPLSVKDDRVLCVGINRYPGARLNGCVPDAKQSGKRFSRLLSTGVFRAPEIEGDDEEDADYELKADGVRVRLMLNGAAKTKGMLNALAWLIEGAKPGDIRIFFFSGHGTQVPTQSDIEEDGQDEAICPQDTDWEQDSTGRFVHMITDKQIMAIFKTMPEGVSLWMMSDSCNSGDLVRKLGSQAKRYPIEPKDITARKASARLKKGEFANEQVKIGYVSGCRDDQTSADAVIEGGAHGALTWYFWKAFDALPADATLRNVGVETNRMLKAEGYDQTPQTEGAYRNVIRFSRNLTPKAKLNKVSEFAVPASYFRNEAFVEIRNPVVSYFETGRQ